MYELLTDKLSQWNMFHQQTFIKTMLFFLSPSDRPSFESRPMSLIYFLLAKLFIETLHGFHRNQEKVEHFDIHNIIWLKTSSMAKKRYTRARSNP